MSPKDGPDVPFDRQIIAGLREQSDNRLHPNFYMNIPFKITWLWWERMITTLEECQQLRERVRVLEKQLDGNVETVS